MKFLDEEWTKEYAVKWNENESLRKSLKKFSGVFQYQVSDVDAIEPIQLEVKNGEILSSGAPVEGRKIDFDMWASLDGWRQVVKGEKSVKAAMMSPGFGFKGSKIKAAMYMGAFENSINMMSSIEADFTGV